MRPYPVDRDIPGAVDTTSGVGIRKCLVGGVALAALVGLGAFVFSGSEPDGESEPSDPNLPQWFASNYRIRPARRQAVAVVPDLGLLNLPTETTAPAGFTSAWFDEHFTHYAANDAFVYARPKLSFYSDGKIRSGIRLLVGQEAGELTLVCTCTADGRPINMYVRREALRERAKSAPPPAKV